MNADIIAQGERRRTKARSLTCAKCGAMRYDGVIENEQRANSDAAKAMSVIFRWLILIGNHFSGVNTLRAY